MVEIIEALEPPLTKEDVFKFKVYRSPKDGTSILGYLEPYGIVNAGGMSVTWYKTDFGVPVAEAFRTVVEMARSLGIKAVLVVDDEGLFPEDKRPIT